MSARNFNNEVYRNRSRRARRQQALRRAQRRLIQDLYRNRYIPTQWEIQTAREIFGNRSYVQAEAEIVTPQLATVLHTLDPNRNVPTASVGSYGQTLQGPPAIATLLTQQNIPNAEIVIDPRQAHDRYMRALGLSPNFRPSN